MIILPPHTILEIMGYDSEEARSVYDWTWREVVAGLAIFVAIAAVFAAIIYFAA